MHFCEAELNATSMDATSKNQNVNFFKPFSPRATRHEIKNPQLTITFDGSLEDFHRTGVFDTSRNLKIRRRYGVACRR